MRRTVAYGLLALASWAVASLAAAQSAPLSQQWDPQLPLRQYNATDGMSQGDVLAIDQDSSGHLWIATHRGLNRFDGNEFLNFTKADGLLHNEVTTVYAAADGRVWFSDINGNLLNIENNQVSEIVPLEGFESHQIIRILEFEGYLVLATRSHGLYIYSPDEPRASPQLVQASSEPTRDLTIRDGALFFVQDGSLFRWETTSSEPVRLEHEQVVGSASSIMTSSSAGTAYWIVREDGEVQLWYEDALVRRHQFPDEEVFVGLKHDYGDTLWVATRQGVYGYRNQSSSDPSERTEVTALVKVSQVNALFVDRENTLWLGRYGGLYRHLGHRFQHYENKLFGSSNIVWAISQDSDGSLYFGTNDGLIRRRPSGEAVEYSSLVGMPSSAYRGLVATPDGWLYAGTLDGGTYAVDVARAEATLMPGTEKFIVLDMKRDEDGWLWLATEAAGVVRVDPEGRIEPQSFEQTTGAPIFSLTIDPNRSVWYGQDGVGVGVLNPREDGQFSHDFYGAEDGLSKLLFCELLAVGAGQLWIVGEDSRLLYFDNGEITDYTKTSPMRDQNVYTVSIVSEDSLLLGGEKGVSLFNPETLESRGLGPLHGFVGMEVNAHATFLDREGFLWFGTMDGATRMDLNEPLPERVRVSPIVTIARIQGSNKYMREQQELAYFERDIQLSFTDVSLSEPFGVEYSYRLVGRDNEWSQPGRTRSVNYSGLTPGKYRFEVRGRYIDGDWFENSNSLAFSVLAPYWRTPWFLALAALAIALLLYLGVWIRTSGIERLNQRLREEVQERTRSLEEGRVRLLETNQQLVAESEERRRADKARAEVETRFRVAFTSTPIGMVIVDRNGSVLHSNSALRRMFLAPENHDNAGVAVNALSFIDDEEKGSMKSDLVRLRDGEINRFDGHYMCRRYDGKELYTHMFMTAVRDENSRYKYLIAQVQDITESRRLTDALEYQASHDELSGLLNRRSFELALDRAHAQSATAKAPSYLMFMDLDQFKIVNDTSGHSAGDELLRQVSEVIREQVRGDDTVGRLGGDEFGLILWNCPPHVAYRIAESVRAAIEDFQFQWEANTYRVGVSIGAVVIDQGLGSTAEIQQLADAACYHSKDHGRNRVHFVQEEGESINEQRGEVRWLQRLNEAMDSSNFALYGQIIKPVDLESREPERIEILLRLREPKSRKIVPPGAFLPAAERYGLITKLDQWVVENLLRMLYVHHALGSAERRYWVNLSGTSVSDKRFVDFLIDAVRHCGLPAGMINFEITETAVIRNVGEAGRMMSSLHEMGCQFALDDFGSGLSSFGYLKKLPVDYIKIDGMFVRDILTDEIDRVFVRSIIDISRTMGIKSIAEFVENDRIRDAVSDLGVDYVQGFGVHRPEALFADLRPGALIGAGTAPLIESAAIAKQEKRA